MKELNKNQLKILVVDDSQTQLYEAKYLLENEGYDISTAVNAKKALEEIEKNIPDIIITDIVMPEIDGYELCSLIKNNSKTKNIPVILLTALSDTKEIIKSIKAGADKFLTKPMNIDVINSVISQVFFNINYRDENDNKVKLFFNEEEYSITSNKKQILDLLISSYESAYIKNKALIQTQDDLEKLNLSLEVKVQQRTKELEFEKDKALKLSSQNQLLLDNAGDGIFGLDEFGKIYFINLKACEILEYGKDEILGKRKFEIIKEHKNINNKPITEVECKMLDTLKNKTYHKVYDEHFYTKSGKKVYIEFSSSPINLNNASGAVIVFSDVTEKIELENRLKEKDKMMLTQSRSAAMGEMIGMIAHQWKQPLSVLSMLANNMRADFELEDLKLENFKSYAEQINIQVKHLSTTIDDFRNFFKPHNEKSITNIVDVIDKTIELIGKSLENNGILLKKEFKKVRDLEIFPNELSHVLLNILKNAKEAIVQNGIKKGMIIIRLYEENDIYIEIEDNAGGIDEKIIDKIFEPYFTTKENLNGTGLGLYMSKIIIENHFTGQIYVRNVEKGVVFIIKIPLK